MVQSALLTLDAVNVLDMLGFSLETRRGQEMTLINRSVQQIRRNFAHTVAPPSMKIPSTSSSSAPSTASKTSSTITQEKRPQNGGMQSQYAADVIVQSHEQPANTTTSELRQRQSKSKPVAVHPTYYVNNERV